MPVIPQYNEQKAREHFIFRMFPKTFLLLFAILICGDLFGKNHEKRITATEEILMNNEFVSIRTYQEMAMEQAINKALDQAFGSTVIDNYEHISSTISKGHHSVNSFQELSNNYINTFPNGRWVKSVKDPSYQQYKDEKGNFWLKCTVVGIGESIKSATVKYVSDVLDGENPEDVSETFVTGESGYIHFKSPASGYLAIYFDDLNNIQRCLPYNAYEQPCFPVKANKDYIFFSKSKCDYLENKENVDEVEFYTHKPFENNRFYILYSPKPFLAPLLDKPEKMQGGYSSFWHTQSHLFMKWLEENRLRNSELQVKIIWITVKNSEL